jgi:3-phosphoshikimate 1-carboxyvinyltransferase
VRCRMLGQRRIVIKGKQAFRGLKDFRVPSDYGLAAFHMAAAALLPSQLVLQGHFDDRLVQSDGHILDFLKRMGVSFRKTAAALTIKGPFAIRGGKFSLRDCPDLVPVMTVLAMFADRRTELINISHARVKESDRITDLRKELLKVGAKISETADSLIIDPISEYHSDRTLDPHSDHRLAMAFAILGLKIGCRIKNIECTRKSYPAFVKDFAALGI